ncbi:hypothetical protein SUDANB1_05119 [Streptomyces sp. enrichment culture]
MLGEGVGAGLGLPAVDAGGVLGSRRFGGGVRSGGVASAFGSRVAASAALMGRARGGS